MVRSMCQPASIDSDGLYEFVDVDDVLPSGRGHVGSLQMEDLGGCPAHLVVDYVAVVGLGRRLDHFLLQHTLQLFLLHQFYHQFSETTMLTESRIAYTRRCNKEKQPNIR